jgi:predicted nucleotidyltransferase
MSKQDILEIIRQTRPELTVRFGVDRLGLFGSYVRGQERRRSDIDLLVSFQRDIDLFEFLALKEFLQERLHHKVDLVMDSALKPSIGKRIRAEVEYV